MFRLESCLIILSLVVAHLAFSSMWHAPESISLDLPGSCWNCSKLFTVSGSMSARLWWMWMFNRGSKRKSSLCSSTKDSASLYNDTAWGKSCLIIAIPARPFNATTNFLSASSPSTLVLSTRTCRKVNPDYQKQLFEQSPWLNKLSIKTKLTDNISSMVMGDFCRERRPELPTWGWQQAWRSLRSELNSFEASTLLMKGSDTDSDDVEPGKECCN